MEKFTSKSIKKESLQEAATKLGYLKEWSKQGDDDWESKVIKGDRPTDDAYWQKQSQEYNEEVVSQKLVSILQRYESLKVGEGEAIMENLLMSCESLKKEPWLDKLAATVMVRFLAEVAEEDHKIEKTEIQLLNNMADIFDVTPPRI